MNAIAEKPQPVPADTQTTAEPRRAPAVCVASGVRRPALVAAIGIGVTASWWFTEGRYIESTDNAYIQGDIAVLSPRIEGDVAAIKVADNQRVRAGDPLIVLDPADWRARLAQADRRRRRGHGRDRDGAAPGRPAAGHDRCRAGRHRPGPGRAGAGHRRCRPAPDRWWQAAGPRASPTTRRSPTRARPTPRWPPRRRRRRPPSSSLAC